MFSRNQILYFIAAVALTSSVEAATQRLAFSEKLGVEVLALADSSGAWCRPDLTLNMVVKDDSALLQPSGLNGFLPKLRMVFDQECPTAKTAKVALIKETDQSPVGSILNISKAAGWMQDSSISEPVIGAHNPTPQPAADNQPAAFVLPRDIGYPSGVVRLLRDNPALVDDDVIRWWAAYRFNWEYKQFANQEFKLQPILQKAKADLASTLSDSGSEFVNIMVPVQFDTYDFNRKTFPIVVGKDEFQGNKPMPGVPSIVGANLPNRFLLKVSNIDLITSLPFDSAEAEKFIETRTRFGNVNRTIRLAMTVKPDAAGVTRNGRDAMVASGTLISAAFLDDKDDTKLIYQLSPRKLEKMREAKAAERMAAAQAEAAEIAAVERAATEKAAAEAKLAEIAAAEKAANDAKAAKIAAAEKAADEAKTAAYVAAEATAKAAARAAAEKAAALDKVKYWAIVIGIPAIIFLLASYIAFRRQPAEENRVGTYMPFLLAFIKKYWAKTQSDISRLLKQHWKSLLLLLFATIAMYMIMPWLIATAETITIFLIGVLYFLGILTGLTVIPLLITYIFFRRQSKNENSTDSYKQFVLFNIKNHWGKLCLIAPMIVLLEIFVVGACYDMGVIEAILKVAIPGTMIVLGLSVLIFKPPEFIKRKKTDQEVFQECLDLESALRNKDFEELGSTYEERTKAINEIFDRKEKTVSIFVAYSFEGEKWDSNQGHEYISDHNAFQYVVFTINRNLSIMDSREREILKIVELYNNLFDGEDKGYIRAKFGLIWGDGKAAHDVHGWLVYSRSKKGIQQGDDLGLLQHALNTWGISTDKIINEVLARLDKDSISTNPSPRLLEFITTTKKRFKGGVNGYLRTRLRKRFSRRRAITLSRLGYWTITRS